MAGGNLTLDEFLKLSREEQNKRYSELSKKDKFGARQADVSLGEVFVPCNYCSHYHGFAKCDAYPEGIPKEIMHSVIENSSYRCSGEISFVDTGKKWKYGDSK